MIVFVKIQKETHECALIVYVNVRNANRLKRRRNAQYYRCAFNVTFIKIRSMNELELWVSVATGDMLDLS